MSLATGISDSIGEFDQFTQQLRMAEEAIDTKHFQTGGDGGPLGRPAGDYHRDSNFFGVFRKYDKGYIYYTADTGAHEVHGAILGKWASLGFEKSSLGYPKSDETKTADGTGRFNRFERGMIYWSPATGAHEVHGAILSEWAGESAQKGPLGYPVSDETHTADGIGRFSRFQRGSIYYSPSTGAHEIHGAILGKWSLLGFEKSFLGYPLSNETTTPDGIGRYNHFQHGSIYWSPATGAHEVHGAIRAKWGSLGFERGTLGYPTSDEFNSIDGGRVNTFQHGQIYWWPDMGTVVNLGAPLSGKPQPSAYFSNSIVFPGGIAITASYDTTIDHLGNVELRLHAHASTKAVSYDYGIVIVYLIPSGIGYTLSHGGHVSNVFLGDTHDDDPVIRLHSSAIENNWGQFSQVRILVPDPTADSNFLGVGWEEEVAGTLLNIVKRFVKISSDDDPQPEDQEPVDNGNGGE